MASNIVLSCARRVLRTAAPFQRSNRAFRTCAVPQSKRSGDSSKKGDEGQNQMMQQQQQQQQEQSQSFLSPTSSFFGPLLSPWSAMAPTRGSPLGVGIDRLLHDLEDDFQIFGKMFGPAMSGETSAETSPVAKMADRLWAAVDVHENEKEFDLRVDVPGLSEKDINVKVDNGMLVISGERKQENVQEDKKMKRIERSYGSFERRFRLPVTIKENEITAKLSNGVLNVVIPKNPEAEPKGKTIKIEAGEQVSQPKVDMKNKLDTQETVIGGAQADA